MLTALSTFPLPTNYDHPDGDVDDFIIRICLCPRPLRGSLLVTSYGLPVLGLPNRVRRLLALTPSLPSRQLSLPCHDRVATAYLLTLAHRLAPHTAVLIVIRMIFEVLTSFLRLPPWPHTRVLPYAPTILPLHRHLCQHSVLPRRPLRPGHRCPLPMFRGL